MTRETPMTDLEKALCQENAELKIQLEIQLKKVRELSDKIYHQENVIQGKTILRRAKEVVQ